MPHGYSHWPKISIITPSFNQAEFIEETIRSVLLQGYQSLEYIVVDGGSSDGTLDIIKQYEKWFSWWASESDRGQSHAINKGFGMATGDIVAWLNSDDHYLPGTLHTVAEYYIKYPNAGAWVGGTRQIDVRSGKTLWNRMAPPLNFDSLAGGEHPYPPQPSAFLNRAIIGKELYLDERYQIQMDFDLWLRITKNSKMVSIPQILSIGYTHENAKTARPDLKCLSLAEKWTVLLNHAGIERTKSAIQRHLSGDFKTLYMLKSIAEKKWIRLFTPMFKAILRKR
jgi:glycosyltransferase involved in cell wall biosynthesis